MVVHKNTITVTGLKSLYSQWSTLKPYLAAMPPEDITLDIPYIRVQGNPGYEGQKCLRIVAFHGTPAVAEQFQPLAEALAEICNVDFIAPTFPDLKFTLENRIFWQSSEERLALMEAFLKKLDVRDIDIAIGHSTGGSAALKFALNSAGLKSRSICLICTNLPRLVHKFLGPEWLQGNLLYSLKYPCMQPFVVLFYQAFIRAVGLKKKMSAYDAMTSVFSQYATRYWEKDSAPKDVREATTSGLPRMMVYGGRDFLLTVKYSHRLAHDLGNADPANHYTYQGREEPDLKLIVKPPEDCELPIVTHFTHGGHYCFQQYPKTIAKHVLEFAKKSNLIDNVLPFSEQENHSNQANSTSEQQLRPQQLNASEDAGSKVSPIELQTIHQS